MDRTELSKIIDANISKIYKKYQDANKIETGDISPEDGICIDGSRPRVAVKSNPYYKKTIKEFIENF